MRYGKQGRLRRVGPILVIVAAGLCGCASDQKTKSELTGISRDLGEKNIEQAIAQADQFLKDHRGGPGSAEALYLRGRAFEERVAQNPTEVRGNLASARSSYERALQLTPPPAPNLEAYIRTSLGNVAFHQEDYSASLAQNVSAYKLLDRDDLRSWTLLRAGVCLQRLGQFTDADNTLAAVQRQFPGSAAAQRARERQGLRKFWVQLAVYKSAAGADKDVASLRGERIARSTDAQGRHVLRLGPYATYAEARLMRIKYGDRYSEAYVIP